MTFPPVVFLHGFATSSERTWRDTGWVDILADEGREAHLIDILGHGDAPKPADPEAYADLEDWVWERLPEGQIDAVGFSMGGHLLLALASRSPEKFRRLVIAGVGNNAFRHDPEHGQMVREAIAGNAPPDNPIAQHFSFLASSPESDRLALSAFLQRERPPMTPETLANLTSPVLVIFGDQDFAGPVDPLMEALPNATLKILPGVDHFATPKNFACIEAAVNWLSEA